MPRRREHGQDHHGSLDGDGSRHRARRNHHLRHRPARHATRWLDLRQHRRRHTGLDRLVAGWTISEGAGVRKPDRRIFDHALAALGSAPGRTLHVGDSHERDVRAAKSLGMRTAWLVPASRLVATDADADLTITSLSELEERITRRNGATEGEQKP